jgi:hypothetical protein
MGNCITHCNIPAASGKKNICQRASATALLSKIRDKSSIFSCPLARVYCAVYNLDCFFGHTGSPGQNSERLFLGGKPV